MMAISNELRVQKPEPSEIEMLLPWHATGALNARDSRRVSEALAQDPELAGRYAAICEEYDEISDLNESLGAPSQRAAMKLFAAIDAEPPRGPRGSPNLAARLSGEFGRAALYIAGGRDWRCADE
jgi:anti-sigma factor RsiW